jgi:hypothetical protein
VLQQTCFAAASRIAFTAAAPMHFPPGASFIEYQPAISATFSQSFP